MKSLNDTFRFIFVINLETRQDRLLEITEESKRIGFQFKRINAFTGGAIGATRSHLKIAEMAEEDRVLKYFCLEDDAVFCPDFATLFSKAINDLPEDWDMFLLGFNHQLKPIPITENISKVRNAYCLHAYAVNAKFYDRFIEALENDLVRPCDVVLGELYGEHNVYCTSVPLVYQRDSYSDIEKKDVSYPFLKTGSLQVYNMGKYSEDINF